MGSRLHAVVVFATFLTGTVLLAGENKVVSMNEEFHVGPVSKAATMSDIRNSAAKVRNGHALGALTAAERARLSGPESKRSLATRVGIVRDMPDSIALSLTGDEMREDKEIAMSGGLLERTAGGEFIWTTSFSSPGAGALRLNIVKATLPQSAKVFVYSAEGEVHGPYDVAQIGQSFWTNTVYSDQVFVEVHFAVSGSEKVYLEFPSLLHIEHPSFAPPRAISAVTPNEIEKYPCFMVAACVPGSEFDTSALNDRARGIAAMQYISGGDGYVCTGGLLNDTDTSTVVPWFLTANHCIEGTSEAATLELFWDYKRASCSGADPNKGSMPRQLGASLLAMSSHVTGADFSFLRLNSTPPGSRFYLGWTTTNITRTPNLTIYRLHHPEGRPLHYSRQRTAGIQGGGYPEGAYIFSDMVVGANFGGSSGSPVFTFNPGEGARVVGNLSGSNASSEEDLKKNCDYNVYYVRDGAFSTAFPQIEQYLTGSGSSPVQPAPCIPNSTHVCLSDDRFDISVTFNTPAGQSGTATAIKYTPSSALFWFFGADNIEMLIKVINACGFNQRFWVYGAATTDVGYVITVRDTKTGTVKTYPKNAGTPAPAITDSNAFSTCP